MWAYRGAVLPNIISYALLRFEINIRASTVIGFVGVGEAALGPIALVVFAAYFTKEKLPLALGIWGTGPFLGSALAGWGGAAIITNMDIIKPYIGFLSNFSDWRITFFLFAIPGLLFALFLKFLPFPETNIEKTNQLHLCPFLKRLGNFSF